jgi:hypothetical protein
MTRTARRWLLACLFIPGSAGAALVRFDFEAVLGRDIGSVCIAGHEEECDEGFAGLPAGTSVTGGWTVDDEDIGVPYSAEEGPGMVRVGSRYPLLDFQMRIGPTLVQTSGEFDSIEVSTVPIPDDPEFWTTGFSSDYIVFGVPPRGDAATLVGGEPLLFFALAFAHDGNDLWSAEFSQPLDAGVISGMNLGGGVFLRFNSGHTDVQGGIVSVISKVLPPTPVPLPSGLTISSAFAAALPLLRRCRNDIAPAHGPIGTPG